MGTQINVNNALRIKPYLTQYRISTGRIKTIRKIVRINFDDTR